MITFAQFTEIVEQLAPLKYAYEWDNSGVQAHVHDEVSKVLVCLDMTKDTLREAKEKGCDTILAHHPVLFRQVKNLEKNHVVTGLIVDAVRNGINVYSAHTSFDCAPGGINDLLAEKLGVSLLYQRHLSCFYWYVGNDQKFFDKIIRHPGCIKILPGCTKICR